jgi:phosphoglycolate phosphatase
VSASAVVFDLDGTLVDSLGDIVTTFVAAFTNLGLPAPAREAVRALVGGPLEEMYAAFAPADAVAALTADYRSNYPRTYRETSRPYPGVVELLTVLGERGHARVVATTKRSDVARGFVAAMGLSDLLDHVQGTDGFPHKPAPDVIVRALEAVGANGSWMVGDTVTDVQAGKAAGLKTYAVSWGTHDAAVLATAAPDVLRADLNDLVELVL